MLRQRPARQGEGNMSNAVMKLTIKSRPILLKVFAMHLLSPSQTNR